MPLSDYIPDNIATRGVARPLAGLADYYMASRQQPPRQAMSADSDMGYPLTPQQEAMYAQASPRRVVQLTPEELAAFNAQRNAVDTSYSGSGGDFGAEQPVQAVPVAAQPASPQQQEAAPMYPERQHELRRQDLRSKMLATNELMTSLIQRNDPSQAETIRGIFKDRLDKMVNPEDLKSFDESASAKVIMPQIDNLAKIRDMSKIVYKEVTAAEKEKDPNKKRERLQLMIPKLTQSSGTGGTDAMQIGEFFLGAPELGDYQLWAQTLPGGAANVNNLMTYLADPKRSGFIARPDDYIEKIKGNYNSIASVRNERISELEASSSPEWFGRVSGLKPLPLFKSSLESELEGKKLTPQTTPAATLEKPKRIRFEMKGGALMPIQD